MSGGTMRNRDRGGDGGPRLALYDAVAARSAGLVIRQYSTSFGLAARLLGPGVRQHVANVYALVRVADEIVDGGAADAGADDDTVRRLLDDLERDTERALVEGYSANLVVHAFARTAAFAGIDPELTAPFYASMRMDLDRTEHDAESFRRYVYGSAEVVGLMCLRIFLAAEEQATGRSPGLSQLAVLEDGARALGAAFQKVNFLRDLSADADALGRSYFPGVDPATLDEAQKVLLLDDIDADLARAAESIPLLPRSARRAVATALGVFAELAQRLRATPAVRLRSTRVRVPDAVKLRIALATAVSASVAASVGRPRP